MNACIIVVCVHAETKYLPHWFFILFFFFLRESLLLGLELTNLKRLSGQQAPIDKKISAFPLVRLQYEFFLTEMFTF